MRNFLLLGILVLAVTVASNSLFVVKQTERAVMLQFGEIVNADIEPGLHVKMPLVNTVRKFDARILTEDSPRQRYLTLEQKALEVDSYAKWRIVDVGQFYRYGRKATFQWWRRAGLAPVPRRRAAARYDPSPAPAPERVW